MRRIIVNAAWLSGESLIRIFVGLLVGILVARHLGPEGLGRLAFCIAYVSIFIPLSQLGLDRIAVRELSLAGDAGGATLGSVMVLRLAAGAAAAAAAILLFPLAGAPDPGTQLLMVCVLSAALPLACGDAIDLWFQSQMRMRYSALSRNAGFLLSSAIRLWLVFAGAGVAWFTVAAPLEAVAILAGLLLFFRVQRPAALRLRFSAARSVELLRESRFVLAYGFVIMVQARLDQVMLARMSGDAELGQYAAALGIVESLMFVAMAVLAAMSPMLSRLRAQDPARYRLELTNMYRWVVLLFLPSGVMLALFSDAIIRLLYGPAFAASGPLLALLAIRLLLAYVGVARSAYVVNEKLYPIALLIALGGAVINIVLNLAFIPLWGATGAVWASTLSFFFTAIVGDLLFTRTRENFFLMTTAMLTPWRARAVRGN